MLHQRLVDLLSYPLRLPVMKEFAGVHTAIILQQKTVFVNMLFSVIGYELLRLSGLLSFRMSTTSIDLKDGEISGHQFILLIDAVQFWDGLNLKLECSSRMRL